MASREFDLVVLGATGFTGQLVVQYLVDTYGIDGDLKWAIAGRNRTKLEAVRKTCTGAAQQTALPIIIADSDDNASLAALAQQTRVLCSTVGPYAQYGTPVVAACVEQGTHYCDLTGEVQWMAQVIHTYQEQAQQSGARIVHTCGFDSIPFDMGNWFLQQSMQQQYGVYAQQVKTRVGKFSGGASGGTIASMLNMMEDIKRDPSLRKVMADPYALYPPGAAPGADRGDQLGPVYDEDFKSWTAPFVMAAVNTRVVRRSNALLGFPWGEDFRYGEALLTDSRYKATRNSVAAGAGMLAMALGPTRMLARRFLPQPGEGPTKEQRENGFYEIFLLGIYPDNRSYDTMVKVTGDMDPGYGSTSKMLGESAVCLAQDDLDISGGFWTPAAAMQGRLIERLSAKAGLRFELVDPASV